MESFDKLKQAITAAEEDVAKFDAGNKSAGTRVRKHMQEIKNLAQDVREKVLEVRDAAKPAEGAPTEK
jgi:hypothetical protein